MADGGDPQENRHNAGEDPVKNPEKPKNKKIAAGNAERNPTQNFHTGSAIFDEVWARYQRNWPAIAEEAARQRNLNARIKRMRNARRKAQEEEEERLYSAGQLPRMSASALEGIRVRVEAKRDPGPVAGAGAGGLVARAGAGAGGPVARAGAGGPVARAAAGGPMRGGLRRRRTSQKSRHRRRQKASRNRSRKL